MNYLDLFSGIGGFHLGLNMAGFQFDKVYYSEIDKYANKVYAKNFPEAIPLGDITKVEPRLLPKINIVTGGFPCQDISVAGKQKGITGERSSLFHEIIRLCSVLRPRVMLLENVPNLITGGNGTWFRTVLESIASIGYDAEWQIISAADVGAQHLRKRVWILAYPNKKRRYVRKNETCAEYDRRYKALSSSVQGCEALANPISAGLQERKLQPRIRREKMEAFEGENFACCCEDVADSNEIGWRRILEQQRIFCKEKQDRAYASSEDRVNWGENTQWPTWKIEPNVGRVADGVPSRVDRLKGLGNAVVPQVVQLIGEMILESDILK